MNAQILKDFNVSVNGIGNLGKSKEVKLPSLKFKTVEVDNGGMAGSVEVPVNLDKMEAEFDFADIDPVKMGLVGRFHTQGTLFTFRGSIKDGIIEHPVVAVLGGSIIEVEPDLKKGEEVKSKFKLNVSYYSLFKTGVQIYLIDKINNIVTIGGVDINAVTRANIGV